MVAKTLQLLGITSLIISVVSVMLLAVSISLYPWDHRISLAENLHIGLWCSRIVFFNDADYGPYRGSVVALSDDDDDVPFKTEGIDFPGVYVRYIHRTDFPPLWTVMVSLFWPAAIFAGPSVYWMWRCWRRLQ